jgi:molecular chaperone DnaK
VSGFDERRAHPRSPSFTRILWSVVGRSDLQIDRLRDVSITGALVATDAVARLGEEIRFDLLDDAGEKLATGLARVVWVTPRKGMGISFLALGIDPALVASVADRERSSASPSGGRPPPIPGGKVNAPPLPGEHLQSMGAPPSSAKAAPGPAAAEDDILPEIEPLAVRKTRIVIGIDLGTTNTCASYVHEGRPRIIPGRTGTNTIPSMITFDPDGKHHVGQRAADRQVLHPKRTIYGSKRLIGRTYRREVAAELQKHFAYPLAEADGQRFGVDLDDRVVSMDRIAALVLGEVKSSAEAHLGASVEAAVITVPAYFSEAQREAVRRAAKEADLVVHRIVNEPTAAAVAYGHKQAKKSRVAVWDFGGGTFDFSVVDVSDGRLEVVTTGGDNFVGGADFDDILASHIIGEFQIGEGAAGDPDPQQIARLREAAELAKRALSVQTEYLVELHDFVRAPGAPRKLTVEVTRARFEELTLPLVARTVAIATEVLAAAGIGPADVEDVILVGGSTRIPAVQRAVETLFGRRPSKRINPDEAVALGAALLADEIGSGAAPELLDVLPMSVGYGAPGGKFTPIVARNSRLPAESTVTVEADLLGTAMLPIFQGESAEAQSDEYICTALVEDASLRDKGRVTYRLSFDEHCVMAVDARDAKTNRPYAVTLERSRPVDEVLRELGTYAGPKAAPSWRPPESSLGRVFGKLFKVFGRK